MNGYRDAMRSKKSPPHVPAAVVSSRLLAPRRLLSSASLCVILITASSRYVLHLLTHPISDDPRLWRAA